MKKKNPDGTVDLTTAALDMDLTLDEHVKKIKGEKARKKVKDAINAAQEQRDKNEKVKKIRGEKIKKKVEEAQKQEEKKEMKKEYFSIIYHFLFI